MRCLVHCLRHLKLSVEHHNLLRLHAHLLDDHCILVFETLQLEKVARHEAILGVALGVADVRVEVCVLELSNQRGAPLEGSLGRH